VKFTIKLVLSILISVPFALLEGLALWLAVKVIRSVWLPDLPSIKYWPAVLVMLMLGLVVTAWRMGTKTGEAIADA
jgi:hypothetical protein